MKKVLVLALMVLLPAISQATQSADPCRAQVLLSAKAALQVVAAQINFEADIAEQTLALSKAAIWINGQEGARYTLAGAIYRAEYLIEVFVGPSCSIMQTVVSEVPRN